MRNDSLPSTINESTLVPKLTFLEREANELEASSSGAGNPVGADRLRAAFVEYSSKLNDLGPAVPDRQRFDSWLAGDPISAADLGYLSSFFQSRYATRYEDLEPEQKKVFNQIRRFFRFYGENFSSSKDERATSSTSGRSSSGSSSPRLLDVQIVLTGLLDHLDDARNQIEEDRPNSPESQEVRDKSLELINFLDEKVDIARLNINRALVAAQEDVSSDQIALFEEVGEEFKRWIQSNNPEIVDAVMRLTPAASFIGIMSLAGANMMWATPVVLALCGGKKIVDIVKGIKAG